MNKKLGNNLGSLEDQFAKVADKLDITVTPEDEKRRKFEADLEKEFEEFDEETWEMAFPKRIGSAKEITEAADSAGELNDPGDVELKSEPQTNNKDEAVLKSKSSTKKRTYTFKPGDDKGNADSYDRFLRNSGGKKKGGSFGEVKMPIISEKTEPKSEQDKKPINEKPEIKKFEDLKENDKALKNRAVKLIEGKVKYFKDLESERIIHDVRRKDGKLQVGVKKEPNSKRLTWLSMSGVDLIEDENKSEKDKEAGLSLKEKEPENNTDRAALSIINMNLPKDERFETLEEAEKAWAGDKMSQKPTWRDGDEYDGDLGPNRAIHKDVPVALNDGEEKLAEQDTEESKEENEIVTNEEAKGSAKDVRKKTKDLKDPTRGSDRPDDNIKKVSPEYIGQIELDENVEVEQVVEKDAESTLIENNEVDNTKLTENNFRLKTDLLRNTEGKTGTEIIRSGGTASIKEEKTPEEITREKLKNISKARSYEDDYDPAESYEGVPVDQGVTRLGNVLDKLGGQAMTLTDKKRLYDAIEIKPDLLNVIIPAEDMLEKQEAQKSISSLAEEKRESYRESFERDRAAYNSFDKDRGMLTSLYLKVRGEENKVKKLFNRLDRRRGLFETPKSAAKRLEQNLVQQKNEELKKIDDLKAIVKQSFDQAENDEAEKRKMDLSLETIEQKRKEISKHFEDQEKQLQIIENYPYGTKDGDRKTAWWNPGGIISFFTERKQYKKAVEKLGLAKFVSKKQYIQKRLAEKESLESSFVSLYNQLDGMPESKRNTTFQGDFEREKNKKLKELLDEIAKSPQAIVVLRQILGLKKINSYPEYIRDSEKRYKRIESHKGLLEAMKQQKPDLYFKIGGPEILQKVSDLYRNLSV